MKNMITSNPITNCIVRLCTSCAACLSFLISHFSFLSCSYSEDIDLCTLTVQLVYPENTIEPYAGARVELKALGRNAVFVDSTDAQGTTRFTVTPGIYEASSTAQFLDSSTTTWWRYNFNGVRSMIIVDPDSTNMAEITLKSSRKRVVH